MPILCELCNATNCQNGWWRQSVNIFHAWARRLNKEAMQYTRKPMHVNIVIINLMVTETWVSHSWRIEGPF